MGAAASVEGGEFNPNQGGEQYIIQPGQDLGSLEGEGPIKPQPSIPKSFETSENEFNDTEHKSQTNSYKSQSQQNTVATPSQMKSVSNARSPAPNDVDTDAETEDINPLDILFQFIPYYGQGDPSNDSIVRSTLSSLGVEEIDTKDEYGNTLLLVACQYRCEDLARIILNKGADPNALNASGACCLHFTCYRESASRSLAKILLQNGANPEVAESTYGCTPLHYCAGTGDVDFCKMLISYGANIGTYDLYNYTCVDYAREAGMQTCAHFLQNKLLESASTGNAFRTASGRSMSQMRLTGGFQNSNTQYGGNTSFPRGNSFSANQFNKAIVTEGDWQVQLDINTGQKYYTHMGTGECLWEKDYRAKKSGEDKYLLLGEESPGFSSVSGSESKVTFAEPKIEQIGKLTIQEKGGIASPRGDKGSEVGSPLAMNRIMTANMIPRPGTAGINSGMDPGIMQGLLNEAKMKSDEQIEEERSANRALISQKDGKIAKLEAVVETLIRENEKLEAEAKGYKEKIERMSQSGDKQLKDAEAEVIRLRAELDLYRSQVSAAQFAHAAETSKLRALQETLHNLTSNEADRVASEQKAQEIRANEQREREAKHVAEIRALNQAMNDERMRFSQEMAAFKMQRETAERDTAKRHEDVIRGKDREMDRLNREMADTRAKAAQEMSNAQMLIENANKKVAESEMRADQANEEKRSMQAEIEDARLVQQFNAQLHRDLSREQNARKRLHNEMEDMKGRIRVYVRIRPMGRSELEKNCTDAVIKDGKLSVLVLGGNGDGSKKVYDFDQVFGGAEGNSQTDVFKDTKHLVMSVVDGYNVCIFAYGQTGSGKTFTMIGASDIATCLRPNGDFDELAGITPRAVSELFRLLNERTAQVEFEVEVQMFQLYRDGLDDLLADPKKKKDSAPQPLKIVLAEHSSTGLVQVQGAESMIAKTPADVIAIFAKGSSRRATASTQMNAESSRSHLICSLIVKLTNRRTSVASVGKLTLVDLAGSERVDKSGAVGEMLKEAQSINKSLSALGDVIGALTSGAPHTPYRNHPLTMLMSDSIGGNAKTLICKNVTNAVSAPPAQQSAQLNALKKELAKLKKDGTGGAKPSTAAGNPTPKPGLARPV